MRLSAYLPIAFTIAAYANRPANTAITNFNQIATVSVEKIFPPKLPYSTSNMHSENSSPQCQLNNQSLLHFLEGSLIAALIISAQKACAYNKSIRTPNMRFKS